MKHAATKVLRSSDRLSARCSGPKKSSADSSTPRAQSDRPGMKNSQRGLYISRNFRCRQPSRQVFRCGGRLRPSGFSVVGTSSDTQAGKRAAHHHLAGEFHARGVQVQAPDARGVEAAQAAMEIAEIDPEEQPAEIAQHRIAEIAVQRRHGAGLDAAPEAIAHDQFARRRATATGRRRARRNHSCRRRRPSRRSARAPPRCRRAAPRRSPSAAPARPARRDPSRSAATRPCCRCRRSAPRRKCLPCAGNPAPFRCRRRSSPPRSGTASEWSVPIRPPCWRLSG